MLVTLLAITKVKTPDRFCIAGMTNNGKWIRPIPNDEANRFWLRNDLTSGNSGFAKSGDVWEVEGKVPDKFQFPNHTEDFIITKRNYVKRLSNDELIVFLRNKVESESDFISTINANGRSLCFILCHDAGGKQQEDGKQYGSNGCSTFFFPGFFLFQLDICYFYQQVAKHGNNDKQDDHQRYEGQCQRIRQR